MARVGLVTAAVALVGCGRLGFAPDDVDPGDDGPSDASPVVDAWECVADPSWPVARSYPGVAFDETRGELVVHGGGDSNGNGVAETSTWTLAGGWVQHTPVTPGPPVHFSAMAFSVVDARTVLIGGSFDAGANERLDTVWGWDGATWAILGPATGSNYQSSIAYDRSAGLIAYRGGWDFSAAGTAGDWADGWSGLASTPKFTVNQLAYDPVNARVMFFGGNLDATSHNRTLARAAGAAGWTDIDTSVSPSIRASVGMATDLARNQVVMFGGAEILVLVDETWLWDGTSWEQRFPATSPSARVEPRLAYDPAREVVLLYGGVDAGGALNDLWEWDGTTWLRRGPC